MSLLPSTPLFVQDVTKCIILAETTLQDISWKSREFVVLFQNIANVSFQLFCLSFRRRNVVFESRLLIRLRMHPMVKHCLSHLLAQIWIHLEKTWNAIGPTFWIWGNFPRIQSKRRAVIVGKLTHLFPLITLILNRDYNIIVSTRDHGVMKKRLWQTKSWRHDHNIDEEQVSPCPLKLKERLDRRRACGN